MPSCWGGVATANAHIDNHQAGAAENERQLQEQGGAASTQRPHNLWVALVACIMRNRVPVWAYK